MRLDLPIEEEMSPCPSDIAAILTAILRTGLLKLRAIEMTHTEVVIEADHLHNLPGLLTNYYPNGLIYYWDVERRTYLNSVDPRKLGGGFEDAWQRLEFCVAAIRVKLEPLDMNPNSMS